MDREASTERAEKIIEKWIRQQNGRPSGFTQPTARRLITCIAKGLREAFQDGQARAQSE